MIDIGPKFSATSPLLVTFKFVLFLFFFIFLFFYFFFFIFFFCDGQGADRRTILSGYRSCSQRLEEKNIHFLALGLCIPSKS